LAQVEAAIDFPEEDIEPLSSEKAAERIEHSLIEPIQDLMRLHVRKRLWIDGVNTIIVGRVNAGKSSLLNRLLNEERAIVTATPGTTRDIIESTVTFEGLPLRLIDTAGFREVRDDVERIGIQWTERKLAEAELVLLVIDQSRPLNQDDLRIFQAARGKQVVIVLNKVDLNCGLAPETLERQFSGFPITRVSALTGQGLDELRKKIVEHILQAEIDFSPSRMLPGLRHETALQKTQESFQGAVAMLRRNGPLEIVALELKEGLDALGEIVGETTSDHVLESIFSRFCIGK
jgi:tRNA modification GTPase